MSYNSIIIAEFKQRLLGIILINDSLTEELEQICDALDKPLKDLDTVKKSWKRCTKTMLKICSPSASKMNPHNWYSLAQLGIDKLLRVVITRSLCYAPDLLA